MAQSQPTNVTPITAATRASKAQSFSGQTAASATQAISTQTGGSSGGPGDWAHTVETRLGELRTDVRNLLIGGALVAIALAGVGWTVYNSTMNQFRELAVTQKEIAGKIETLDARVAGRLDLMEQRLSDKPQGSAGAGQAQPVSSGAQGRPAG